MARMFPARLPEVVESEAERRLFGIFEREFGSPGAIAGKLTILTDHSATPKLLDPICEMTQNRRAIAARA